ncbi:hypothetical protein D8I35_09545 [Corticibacter populi]|uniref:Uncharacterized protein n=1 Tax=Corticibacter populi TaxID=1550736 RepID=A0A3M6QUM9_9BURK|nr:hypothetical protein [Corticibacter populi]RMX06735.1 hypothetical protein D8I35_09545 [Corticibacter populi]RZS31683.1 hypothetical protein EV687_2352 [Corticibacter populi]
MSTQHSVTLTPRPPRRRIHALAQWLYGSRILGGSSATPSTPAAVAIERVVHYEPAARVSVSSASGINWAYLTPAQLRELAQAAIDAAHDIEHGHREAVDGPEGAALVERRSGKTTEEAPTWP